MSIFKSKDKRLRLIFTDGPGKTYESEFAGKVVAIIGPFECFTDKVDFQNMLGILCSGYNIK